jgi:long-chain fatty acid transport protein
MKALCSVLVALAMAPQVAHAAGYSLYEQSARALGMAGAFTARANDPSAIFFNPAGLAQIDDGGSLLLSPNLIYFKAEFSGVAPFPGYGVEEETKEKTFPPFAAYYAQGIDHKYALGIGVYNPYGLEVDWQNPDTFTGRYISTRAQIKPFYYVPSFAVALSDKFRVGAGVNLVLSNVELERHIAAYDPILDVTQDIGTVVLESEPGFGAGFNAGAQWTASRRLRLGATYRSRVTIDYTGSADFTQRLTGDAPFDAAVTASFPPDQAVATSIPFPAQASFGVAYSPCSSWSYEADFNFTWWSEFDRLSIAFAQTPSRNVDVTESWDDVINIRAGAEYRKGGTAAWSYRAGYYYDKTPQPRASLGPLLPDTDRNGISLGAGWTRGTTAIDAYVLYLITGDRSTEGENRDDYNGTYSLATMIGGVSLGLHFR